jgi:amino acid permease
MTEDQNNDFLIAPFDTTDQTKTTPNEVPNYVSPFSTVMNLLNTLVGAGILGIADTFRFCGFLPSYIVLLFIAILSLIATEMIVVLQIRVRAFSFEQLTEQALGKSFAALYTFAATFFCISGMVVFIIISGNTVQSWLGYAGWKIADGSWTYKAMVLVYALLLPVALTIPKNMHFLSYFSTFSIFCLFLFAFVIIFKGCVILPKQGIHETCEFGQVNVGIFNALAIYSLTFALAAIVMPVIAPSAPSLNTRTITVGSAFFICFTIVSITGVIGYLIFGTTVKPVLLESFPADDILTIIVRAAFFVVVNASYPVVSLTVGTSFARAIFGVNSSLALKGWRRAVVLFCNSSIPVVIAMFLPNIRPALAIGGALGGSLSNFIFPPLIWIRMSDKKLTHWTNILCILLCIFGVIAAIVSTYESVVDAIKQFKEQ